jgi:dephospho-CoA kinase
MPPRNIGLTGGIGSGKSTVAAMLVACGAHLVDTDAIARGLTLPGGAAMPALREAFGDEAVAPDGSLDRDHMRALVFADGRAKSRLEAILHPLIGAEALQQSLLGAGRPVVFDVPLLTASSVWRQRAAQVLVVDCSVETQLERVARRPGWTALMAQQVAAQQLPREHRRALADAVIHNEALTLHQLREQVMALWQTWGLPLPAHGSAP